MSEKKSAARTLWISRRPVKDEVITLACALGCPQTWRHMYRGENTVDKTCPECGRINQYWFGEPARLLVRPKFDLTWGPMGSCEHCDACPVPVQLCRDPIGIDDDPEYSDWCRKCWDLRNNAIKPLV